MRKQINILSIPVDVVTMEEAVNIVFTLFSKKGFHLVATANAEMIMKARSNEKLANLLQSADLVVPDGAGTLWAAEQQGQSFPERVTGFDLANCLLKKAIENDIPVYCLGAAPGVVEKAMASFQDQFGKLHIVGVHSGFFDEEEEKKIIETIKNGGTKLVLVAMGVPKQELWMAKHLSSLDGVVGIGIGGTFDVLAGHVERAPKWMQENRLEWLYRLYKQPKRGKRMLALPKFMWAVKSQKK